jgi:hypothetical protein
LAAFSSTRSTGRETHDRHHLRGSARRRPHGQSLTTPGKLLSLSFWRDEAAVDNWRNHAEHRQAQAAGRAGLFTDYRLRVVSVIRDYGPHDRGEAPADALD